jgi:hypothetical protein
MQREVGIARNGVGLLNGQTAKRDSIASEEGGRGCLQSSGLE